MNADFKMLLEADIKAFIKAHEQSDIRDLGLKKPPSEDWPYPLVLDQIKARQKAQNKLPLWLNHHPDIIFPPSVVMEQASSAATARYKASLAEGKTFADLTGGAGVDTCALTENFESGHCVEQNEEAAGLIEHNIKLLSSKTVAIHHETAETFITDMPEVDLIYLDPQRRDENKKGFFKLEDCTPNILELLPTLKEKTKTLMIKTSPMLDIHQAIEDLNAVSEVHIVEWQGECKEVLYILNFENPISAEHIPFHAVKIDDEGKIIAKLKFTKKEEEQNQSDFGDPEQFLYEPGPAFLKSGAFKTLSVNLGLKKLHEHTHLYTSGDLVPDFPGRTFKILDILPVNKKGLGLKKANLAIRNFPDDVHNLKKKLNLKDGGDDFLFACTLKNESKMLIHCKKLT